MKKFEMNDTWRSIRLFVIIFIVVVLGHLIVGRLFFGSGSNGSDSEGGAPPKVEQKVPAGGAKGTPAAKAAEAERSWWDRFTGWFRSEDKEKSKPAEVKPQPPPPRQWRYRKLSTNPKFGAPLDFSHALHGDKLPASVPGSAGAKTGIVVDLDRRIVLWEKNCRKPVPVASMTKMMTMLLVMEMLEDTPKLSLDTSIEIGKQVMQVPRTGVLYLRPGEVFTLRELLLGTAVKSANDAATQLAVLVSGDVDAFIGKMNARAAALKLPATKFYSPCGLPDKAKRDSLSSAEDMVLLGERLLEYPILLEMASTQKGSIREGEQKTIFVNTNKLITPHYPGVDGLKTGYTNVAGCCLTFSALRDNRRIVGCVTGFPHARDRDRFCRKLIDWAYKQP